MKFEINVSKDESGYYGSIEVSATSEETKDAFKCVFIKKPFLAIMAVQAIEELSENHDR